jgi:hypothetical protein
MVPVPASRPPKDRPVVTWTDWHEVLRSVSPLAEWEGEFAAWRESIAMFRQVEQEAFFPRRDEVMLHHVHRGWTAELISEGEKLAVELLRLDANATDRLEFVTLCVENLQSTLETWHSAQQSEPIKAVPQGR